jgi:hypothetical protein
MGVRNVLARGRVITGIVDWDKVGVGTRALDYTGLLFNWQRLRLTHTGATDDDWGQRLVGLILQLVGDSGFRSLVTYMSIANLALNLRHREHGDLNINKRVIELILNESAIVDHRH